MARTKVMVVVEGFDFFLMFMGSQKFIFELEY
jgi:hypothetical protein